VPIAQERAQMHLDTVCTMVDVDAVVMYPNIVDSLSAFTIRRTADGVTIDDAAPFVEAAAVAMGIDRLRVIDTGSTPSPPNVSSGTTATTPWRWRPVWWSPMNATPKPMPGWPIRVSRCCRSKRPSWAPAAAAHGACPARPAGTRSRAEIAFPVVKPTL
jgi:hypothetical protein